MPSLLQATLAAGELSPALHNRVDLQRWGSGLKLCRNFITLPTGGAKNRAGTKFVGYGRDMTIPCILIPFRRSTDQSYAVEVSEDGFRFVYRGGHVLWGAYTLWTANTDYAKGALVSNGTTNYRALTGHKSGASLAADIAKWEAFGGVGDPVFLPHFFFEHELYELSYAQMGDVLTIAHQHHHPFNVVRYGAWDFRLEDVTADRGPWCDLNADTGKTIYVDQKTGDVTLTASSDLFDAAKHEGRLIYIEQRNFGKPWESGKAVVAGDIRRSDGKYYQALSAGTTGTIKPINEGDTWNDGGVEWNYLHSGYGIARILTVTNSKTATARVVAGSRMPDELSITGYASAITDTAPNSNVITMTEGPTGNIRMHKTAHGMSSANNGIALVEFTTAFAGYYESKALRATVVDVDNIDIDYSYAEATTPSYGGTPYLSIHSLSPALATGVSTYRFKFGAWGGDQGYPSVVSYFQNRRLFAATPTQPHTVWMSRSNSYTDFTGTIPTVDDDPLTFALASGQIDDVRKVISMDRLVLLTEGAEWALGSGQADVVTPGNLSTKPQGYHGVSMLDPLGVGDSALFVQRKGYIVRDIDFDFSRDKYAGSDLTAFASHLTENNSIISWAYQQHPFSVVWMVLTDGTMAGLTYNKEQQVVGWHRHDLKGGLVKSVCCVSEGNEDVVYFVVLRSGDYYIERMANRLLSEVEDAFFVDCGLAFDGRVKTAITADGFDYTNTTMTVTGGTNWNETEVLNIASSDPLFTGGTDIGDALVMGDTTLTIVSVTDSKHAKVAPSQALDSAFRGVATTSWFMARNTFTLAHLPNTLVSVCADGNDEGLYTTDGGGSFTLNRPAVRVAAGLPIAAEGQTLGVNVPGGETTINKKVNITSVMMGLLETNYIKVGRDFDHLFSPKQDAPKQFGVPMTLRDELVQVPIGSSWHKDGSFVFRQDAPLPVTITTLIPEVEIGGV